MYSKYPYIVYPPLVAACLDNTFPEFLPVNPPTLPKLKKIDFTGFVVFFVGATVITILIAIGLNFWVIDLAVGAIALLGLFSSFQSVGDTTKFNNELKKKYIVTKQEAKVETEKRKEEFQKLTSSYQLNSYKTEGIKQVLKSFAEGSLVINIEKKGYSEYFFFKVLYKFFGKHVNSCSKIYDLVYFKNYTPDFIFCNSDICIDIEVDEPYVKETGKPIHCNDQDNNAIRDDFFINNNCCVIRFSEDQVLLYPYECCKFIATKIFELTDNDQYIQKLKHYGDLQSRPTWSKAQAIELASNKFRDATIAKAYIFQINLELYNENHFHKNGRLLLTCTEIDRNAQIICFANNNEDYYTKELRADVDTFINISLGETIEIEISNYQFNQQIITHHYSNFQPIEAPITIISRKLQA